MSALRDYYTEANVIIPGDSPDGSEDVVADCRRPGNRSRQRNSPVLFMFKVIAMPACSVHVLVDFMSFGNVMLYAGDPGRAFPSIFHEHLINANT